MSVYDSETMNGRWRQYIDSYVLVSVSARLFRTRAHRCFRHTKPRAFEVLFKDQYSAGTYNHTSPKVTPLIRYFNFRNLRNADATEDTPKYHAEGGLHIKVDMLTYRLFFVSRTEETYCRERTPQEVRQLDEQAKKTSVGRTKAFDTWLSNRTESKGGEGQKPDDISMEL